VPHPSISVEVIPIDPSDGTDAFSFRRIGMGRVEVVLNGTIRGVADLHSFPSSWTPQKRAAWAGRVTFEGRLPTDRDRRTDELSDEEDEWDEEGGIEPVLDYDENPVDGEINGLFEAIISCLASDEPLVRDLLFSIKSDRGYQEVVFEGERNPIDGSFDYITYLDCCIKQR
jgi:hypothetical protein